MFHIVIPTYNRSHTILRALDSVINQKFQDFIIYVIDDGSTDNTKNLVENYHSKVKYFYKSNGGVSSARNVGIYNALKVSSGDDYILFLDSDDELTDNSLNDIYSIIQENYSYVYFSFGVIDNLGNKTFVNQIDGQILDYKDVLISKKAFGEFFRVLKIDIFLNHKYRFPDGLNGGEDILRNSVSKDYFLFVSNLIVRKYYLDNTSITRGFLDKKKVNNFLNVTKKYIDLFGDDLYKFNKKTLGIHYLVYSRMLALTGNNILSIKFGFKGFIYSLDFQRFLLCILSMLPFGMNINNLILKVIKK